jgi:undecaprenyl-diphosphatase
VLGLLLAGQLGVLVAVGSAFAGVFESVTENEDLTSIDDPVSGFLIGARRPWLNQFFTVVTWAGSGVVLFALVLLVGLGWYRRTREWSALIFLLLCLGGAVALNALIKLLVARPRPSSLALVDADGFGFPSGHSAAATAGWLSLALLFGTRTPRWSRKIALVAGALVIAGLVGLSRVYLGVHEPTDVLGGWSFGALWVLAVVVTVQLLSYRRPSAQRPSGQRPSG